MLKSLICFMLACMTFTVEGTLDTILPNEVAPELAEMGINADDVLNQFREKGGQFIRAQTASPFTLLPGDIVYPLCSGGFCRSQTLWSMLKDFNEITLITPHATRRGFDPFNFKVNWHRNDQEELRADEFPLWAGHPKAVRFGYDIFASWHAKETATPEELKQIRDYYDTYYFQHEPNDKRRIYFSFDANSHAIAYRLNEANDSLHGVYLVHLPLKDLASTPPPEWNTFPRSKVSYENLSQVIQEYINLSEVHNLQR